MIYRSLHTLLRVSSKYNAILTVTVYVRTYQVLLEKLGLKLPKDEFRAAMLAMDTSLTADHERDDSSSTRSELDEDQIQVDQDEFEQWWYIQKHGRPKISPCPAPVLSMICNVVHALPSSPGDEIVPKTYFGERLLIVLQGEIEARQGPIDHERDAMLHAGGNENVEAIMQGRGELVTGFGNGGKIASSATDPVFAMQALLTGPAFRRAVHDCREVGVYACITAHCECLYIEREDLIDCFQHWDAGRHFWETQAKQLHVKMTGISLDDPANLAFTGEEEDYILPQEQYPGSRSRNPTSATLSFDESTRGRLRAPTCAQKKKHTRGVPQDDKFEQQQVIFEQSTAKNSAARLAAMERRMSDMQVNMSTVITSLQRIEKAVEAKQHKT